MTTQIQTQQPSIRNPYTKNNAPIPGQQEKTAQKSHFTTSTSAQTSATLKAIKQLRSKFGYGNDNVAQLDTVSQPTHRCVTNSVNKASNKTRQSKLNFQASFDTDFQWVGPIVEKPASHLSRFWIQNVQSLDISDNFLHFRSLLHSLHSWDAEFLAFTETHLSPYNAYVRENITASYDLLHPEGSISYTNTLIAKNNQDTKQYGGVLSAVNGSLSSRFVKTVNDKYGRYQYSDFYGKDHYLRVYVVYRVCTNNETTAGDNTAWTDQKTLLQKNNEKCVEPRKHITTTLVKAIKDDIKCKRQVLIIGDMNENVVDTKGINKQLTEIGLVNVLTEKLPVTENVRTYDRGSKIIDGVWATPTVCDHVENVSLAPFYTEVESDHRPILLDLNLKGLLDAKLIDIKPPMGRRLKIKSPKRVKQYIEYAKQQWEDHSIRAKISQIEEYLHESDVDDFIEKALNNLDSQIQEILSAAEKRCCKVPSTGKLQWSIRLEKVLKRIRQCKLDLRYLGDSGDHGCGQNYKTKAKPILDQLREARKEFRTVKSKDVDIRKTQMNDQAEEIQKNNPKAKKVKVLKQLSHQEEQMRDARRVDIALNGIRTAGVNKILIPGLDAYSENEREAPGFDRKNVGIIWNKVNVPDWKKIVSWETIENKNDVESMVAEFMRKHLTQAQGTPLTTDEWDVIMQSPKHQEEILSGTFTPPEEAPYAVKDYIKHLIRPATITNEIPFEYDLEDFKTFIKNADERTSSSPSSRHYGHWKTLLKYAPDIFSDLFSIMDIVMRRGIILKRMLKTVMTLLKKEDQPYIHRLRPILLVEVEVQAISSSQWAKNLHIHQKGINA